MKKEPKLTPIDQSIKMMSEFRDKIKEKYPKETVAIEAITHCITFAKECKGDEYWSMFNSWYAARFNTKALDTFDEYFKEQYTEYADTRTNEQINE